MKVIDFTYQGKREVQEDRIFINNSHHIYAVCDGVGSTTHGAEASEFITQALQRDINTLKDISSSGELENYLRALHQSLLHNYTNANLAETYGTTIAILIIKDDIAFVGNIGDSKVFIIANQNHWISKDHSAVQELFDVGILTDEKQMQSHPFRNRITSSLSTTIEPRALLINSEEIVLPESIKPIFLLASDGALEKWTSGALIKHFTCSHDQIVSHWNIFKEKAQLSTDNSSAIIVY